MTKWHYLFEADRDERKLDRSDDPQAKYQRLKLKMRASRGSVIVPFTPRTQDEWHELIDFANENNCWVYIVNPHDEPTGVHVRQPAPSKSPHVMYQTFIMHFPDEHASSDYSSSGWHRRPWTASHLNRLTQLQGSRLIIADKDWNVGSPRWPERLVQHLGIEGMF